MADNEFMKILAARLGIEEDRAGSLGAALGTAVGESMAQLDSVAVSGFGVFEPRKRNERVAVHPATGGSLLVPPRITVSFRASQVLKEQLNNKPADDER